MSNDADNLWHEVQNDLRRKRGLCPLTPEEAQKELESLEDEEISDQELDEIVEAATSGELTSWTPLPDTTQIDGIDTTEVAEDALQLYRNPGKGDADTDDLISRLQREADEEENDGQADEDGLEGDRKPPGKG